MPLALGELYLPFHGGCCICGMMMMMIMMVITQNNKNKEIKYYLEDL